MQDAENVLMKRDGQTTEVANNASVGIMEALGWQRVESAPDAEPTDAEAEQKPRRGRSPKARE